MKLVKCCKKVKFFAAYLFMYTRQEPLYAILSQLPHLSLCYYYFFRFSGLSFILTGNYCKALSNYLVNLTLA